MKCGTEKWQEFFISWPSIALPVDAKRFSCVQVGLLQRFQPKDTTKVKQPTYDSHEGQTRTQAVSQYHVQLMLAITGFNLIWNDTTEANGVKPLRRKSHTQTEEWIKDNVAQFRKKLAIPAWMDPFWRPDVADPSSKQWSFFNFLPPRSVGRPKSLIYSVD